MHRTGQNRGAPDKLAVYTFSGTVAGAAAGAVLGVVGSFIEADTRGIVAAILGLIAVALASVELSGRRVP